MPHTTRSLLKALLGLLIAAPAAWAGTYGETLNPSTQSPDYCTKLITVDGTVHTDLCEPVIVDNGSLTNNGDGTYTYSPARGGRGGATAALDNLASVAINTSLLSDTADTDDLGSTSKEWANLYVGDAGQIYLGLGQDASINRSAANTMTLTASSGVVASAKLTSPIFSSNNADPADAGLIRLGNAELIEWEKAVAGTDWTLGVNSSDVLITNAPFSVGTSNSITAGSYEVGAATDTTITRTGAGDIAIEGNALYRAGGTDVPVADGGSGASTLTGILLGNGTSAFTGLTTSAGVQGALSDEAGTGALLSRTAVGMNFLPQGAVLDDASPPTISIAESTGVGTPRRYILGFDPTTDQIAYWSFVAPTGITAGATLTENIYWYAASTTASQDTIWAGQISCTTPADADSMAEDAAPALNATDTVATNIDTNENNRLLKSVLTIATSDSIAAGDFCTLRIQRDADDSIGNADNDGLTVAANVVGIEQIIP